MDKKMTIKDYERYAYSLGYNKHFVARLIRYAKILDKLFFVDYDKASQILVPQRKDNNSLDFYTFHERALELNLPLDEIEKIEDNVLSLFQKGYRVAFERYYLTSCARERLPRKGDKGYEVGNYVDLNENSIYLFFDYDRKKYIKHAKELGYSRAFIKDLISDAKALENSGFYVNYHAAAEFLNKPLNKHHSLSFEDFEKTAMLFDYSQERIDEIEEGFLKIVKLGYYIPLEAYILTLCTLKIDA